MCENKKLHKGNSLSSAFIKSSISFIYHTKSFHKIVKVINEIVVSALNGTQ